MMKRSVFVIFSASLLDIMVFAGHVKPVEMADAPMSPVESGALILSFDDRNFVDWERAMPLSRNTTLDAMMTTLPAIGDSREFPSKGLDFIGRFLLMVFAAFVVPLCGKAAPATGLALATGVDVIPLG